MSTEEQKLLNDPPSQTTSATDAGPNSPPSEPAPPYQPPQLARYQPVFAAPQQPANNALAAVNIAPTATFTIQQPEYMPDNYLVLNIITLLCCCFIFGLTGLVYSMQVEKEWTRGNHSGARQAARSAKIWGLAGIITGICLIVGSIIVCVIIALVNIFTCCQD